MVKEIEHKNDEIGTDGINMTILDFEKNIEEYFDFKNYSDYNYKYNNLFNDYGEKKLKYYIVDDANNDSQNFIKKGEKQTTIVNIRDGNPNSLNIVNYKKSGEINNIESYYVIDNIPTFIIETNTDSLRSYN
jgi:hypothetical protein